MIYNFWIIHYGIILYYLWVQYYQLTQRDFSRSSIALTRTCTNRKVESFCWQSSGLWLWRVLQLGVWANARGRGARIGRARALDRPHTNRRALSTLCTRAWHRARAPSRSPPSETAPRVSTPSSLRSSTSWWPIRWIEAILRCWHARLLLCQNWRTSGL